MPVDIGKGQQVIPPRDSRSLEIVHFTAELAPIAKVRGGMASRDRRSLQGLLDVRDRVDCSQSLVANLPW
jgi:hypothetical protein